MIYYPKCSANIGLVVYNPETGQDSDLLSLVGVPVLSCSVSCNDLHTADEFTVEIIEKYLPADPTYIKAMEIDLHIANSPPGKPLDTTSDSTRVIVGHADEIERLYGNDGMKVRIKGRDFVGFLLDLKWGARKVELNRDIKSVVTDILGAYPQTAAISVETDGPHMLAGDVKSKKRNYFTVAAETTVWEALVKLSTLAGVVINIKYDTVHIHAPRTVDGSSDPAFFMPGRNLDTLSIKRTLGKKKAPNVLLKCYDPVKGKTVEGRYPKKGEKQANITMGGSDKSTEWLEFVVKKPSPTEDTLSKDAATIHNRLTYNQVAVSFSSRDMEAQTSGGAVVSITSLRNGDSVRVRMDNATLISLERDMNEHEKRQRLSQEGFSNQVAAVLSGKQNVIDAVLFVNKATHNYSATEGYSLSVEATTYLEV